MRPHFRHLLPKGNQACQRLQASSRPESGKQGFPYDTVSPLWACSGWGCFTFHDRCAGRHARIINVNRKFKDLTRWADTDMFGETSAFLHSGVTSEAGQNWRGVCRNLCKDGSSYWAETSLIPLPGFDREVQNFVGIGWNVSETRAARDQVVRA